MLINFFIIFFFFFSLNYGETTSTYLRKSISYYEGFILQRNLNIPKNFLDTLFSNLKKTIFLERFDYNPIPKYLQEKVSYQMALLDTLNLERISNILEKEFVPEIVKILDAAKEIRAREFVSREERVNFLTTKAKEIGVTADDIEKVLNAGYIFVPFINNYSVIREKDLITVNLGGGLIWYNVSIRFSPPKLIPVVKKSTSAFGIANIKKSYFTLGRTLNAEEYAQYSAMNAFLKNLEVLTKEIPDFRLSSDIISAYKNEITFRLGNKEGIKVDDKFNIVEFYEDEQGIRRPKNVGYCLVSKVGNNKVDINNYSIAKKYLGKCEAGMTLLERPRLPIDILLRFVILKEKFSIDLEFDYNVGRYFHFPQFFTTFNLLFSSKKEDDTTKIILKEIGFGLIKKFNISFLSFGLEGKGKITDEGIKLEGKGILEFFLLADLKLGAKVGYDGDINYGFHLNYNPPTLPFDPFSLFRGLFGL
ncbi:MAG: hypothetical protein NZ608_01495 [candidate division WOR-3 bacterium]|nr:hypothetical protein [candidate division WOR-3 bacterium]